MYSWNEKINIKGGEGELKIDRLVPHVVVNGAILKYNISFDVYAYSYRKRNQTRVATVSPNDDSVYSFVYEGETIVFTTKPKK